MTILEFIRNLRWWRTKEERRSVGEYRIETIRMFLKDDYAPAVYRALTNPDNPHAQSDWSRRARVLIDLINNEDVMGIDRRIFYSRMASIEEQAKRDMAAKQAKEGV